jgi:phosphoribosylglycinamide formyltransferase-1
VISNHQEAGALEKARAAGIDALFIDGANLNREGYDKKIAAELDRRPVDLICCIGYMRLFSSWFVNKYKNKIINIHPSILPAFPGMDLEVHKEVLDYGCKVTGCTLHIIDEGVDTGPIIMQRAVEVAQNETVESLKAKVQKTEQEVLIKALEAYRDHRVTVEGRIVRIRE